MTHEIKDKRGEKVAPIKKNDPAEPLVETAVMVLRDTKGRIGISADPGLPMKRKLGTQEAIGLLFNGILEINNRDQEARIVSIVKGVLLQAALPTPEIATPGGILIPEPEGQPTVEKAKESSTGQDEELIQTGETETSGDNDVAEGELPDVPDA